MYNVLKGKIWKVLLLGVFSSWFVLTELCLCINKNA